MKSMTRKVIIYVIFSILSLVFSLSTVQAEIVPLAKPLPNAYVCGEPDKPCTSPSYAFADYDLSFNLPDELQWQTAHNSEYFYAIILKSSRAIYPVDETACGGYFSEQERLSVQAQFPNNKVFAARHGCSMVWYNNVNQQYNFLAIYAGDTFAEAKRLLKTVKGDFTGANIRKMQVVVDNGH